MQRHSYHIGIVGAGTMGASLAQLFAQNGFMVTLVDKENPRVAHGLQRIDQSLENACKKEVFSRSQVAAIRSRIRGTTILQDLQWSHLVIEAIFENLDSKQQLFEELAQVTPKTTLLATNTSSYQVRMMATPKSRRALKQRLLGMHYFYPPAANRLLELIFPKDFNVEQANLIRAVAAATGRVTLECADECGFVVNRFFVPWLHEAVKLLEEQVADLQTINDLSKKEFAADYGAFEIMNMTGLAPVLHSMETFTERFGARYTPCALLRKQTQAGTPWSVSRTTSSNPPADIPAILDRLRTAATFPAQQLIKHKVCTPESIEIGARVGLKWGKGPLQLTNTSGKKMHVSRRQQFHGSYIIELNRPQSMNALSLDLLHEIDAHVKRALKTKSIKRIVLRGNGKTFAAGGDLVFLRQSLQNQQLSKVDAYFQYAQQLFSRIDKATKPVIAYVEGMALGAGVQLALAADLIMVSPEASFEFPETGLGLLPGLGGTQRLPKRIGLELAKFFLLSGQRLRATDALAIGMADVICNSLDWHTVLLESLARQKQIIAQRHERTVPMYLVHLMTEMNNKNTPHLQNKSPEALQLCGQLVEMAAKQKKAGYSMASALKAETAALKKLIRSKTIHHRLLNG